MISLMGSTTPCTIHFAHSFSKEALDAHEVSCPTVTHALVPELYSTLDPQFITAQVRRGVFGVNIFRMMCEAMKVHCAPVRDTMVDEMVRTAMTGNVAVALRQCFNLVEVMKLVSTNGLFPSRSDTWIGYLQSPNSCTPPIPLELGKLVRAIRLSFDSQPLSR